MKKIPTLFLRNPNDPRHLLPEVHPACQWVLDGEGIARRKYDGVCVLIRRDGLAVKVFTRREVKPGKNPPPNFTLTEHDHVTGKSYGWEPAEQSGRLKPINEALVGREDIEPGTYELCGPKVDHNRERYDTHRLVRHSEGQVAPAHELRLPGLPVEEALKRLEPWILDLANYGWEGVVWHHPDGRMAKLKARDFK